MNKTIVLLLPIYIFPVLIFRTFFAYAKHLISIVQKAHINMWTLQNSPEGFYYPVMTVNNSKGNPTQLSAGYPTAC